MTQAPAGPIATPGPGVPATSRDDPERYGSGEVSVTPRQRSAHLGPVHVWQLVALEGLLLVALVSSRAGLAAVLVAALAGLPLAGMTLTRRRGRWLLEWIVLGLRARRRARQVPDVHEPDPRLALLRCLAPRLAVQEIEGTDGSPIGVGYDGEGWFATVAIGPGVGMPGDGGPALPLTALADILERPHTGLDDPGLAAAAVQVVTLTTAAPHAALPSGTPAHESYRELLGSTGPAAVARTTWVTVRLEARVLATVGAGDQDQAVTVPPALSRTVRRMVRCLGAARIRATILDAEGLIAALAQACDVGREPVSGGPTAPQEARRSWRSASLQHATFWVQGWPDPMIRPTVLNELTTVPAALTSVAVRLVAEPERTGRASDDPAVRRHPSAGDLFDVRALARIAAPPDALDAACDALAAAAAQAGARLFRLDGEQAPAVYATAPTGGGPR